jgi:hypothetical protein
LLISSRHPEQLQPLAERLGPRCASARRSRRRTAALGKFLRGRVVAERVGFGIVVSLIIETISAAVHAVVGASTPEHPNAEAPGFSTGKIR